MYNTRITITFISDWHVGSGLGDGAIADSVLNRDADGIPYIPGRAIKGALRESAWRLGLCRDRDDLKDAVKDLFGTGEEIPSGNEGKTQSESLPDKSKKRPPNEPGKIMVGQADLSPRLRSWLLCQPEMKRRIFVGDMTIIHAGTALDEYRQARDHSLRSIECGIPGLAFGSALSIDWPEMEDWLPAYLSALCAGIKSIGADRARGMGECEVRLKGMSFPVTLPETYPGFKGRKSE